MQDRAGSAGDAAHTRAPIPHHNPGWLLAEHTGAFPLLAASRYHVALWRRWASNIPSSGYTHEHAVRLLRGRAVSAVAGRHRRQPDAAYVRIPEHQRAPRRVRMIDAHTHIEHLVSEESLAAHRDEGHSLALCGVRVLAASLTDPGRGWCRECSR